MGSSEAVRFSLIGAILRAGAKPKELMEAARLHLRPTFPGLYQTLACVDEELTHAEALQALDTLIAGLEARPPLVLSESGFVTIGRRALEAPAEKEGSRELLSRDSERMRSSP